MSKKCGREGCENEARFSVLVRGGGTIKESIACEVCAKRSNVIMTGTIENPATAIFINNVSRLPKRLSECPHCHTVNDALTGASTRQEHMIPTIGDLSICATCKTLLIIGESGYEFAPAEALDAVPPGMAKAIGIKIRTVKSA